MFPLRRLLVLIVAVLGTGPVFAAPISTEGRRLSAFLDSMDVEHLWEPTKSVAWKTGKPLDKQGEPRRSNTHCSAFVAAACLRLDVYILRPPDHATTLLANAQADWLPTQGAAHGWRPVKTALEAQRLANAGQVVVAAFKEANSD